MKKLTQPPVNFFVWYLTLIFCFSTVVSFAQSAEKKFEIGAWYGLVFSDGDTEQGLRRADIKYQPNERNLFYIFYDNALILENKFLASMESTAPILAVGAKHDWSSKWFSKIEVGQRFLSLEDDQQLYSMENVYFFSDRSLGKIITQYDVRQNDDLLTVALFYEHEIFPKFRLEGGFFHSENLTLSNTYNERALLTAKLIIARVDLLFGTYYDILETTDLSVKQFGGGYGLVVFPVVQNLKGKLFVNYNMGFFDDEVFIVSLGTDFKF